MTIALAVVRRLLVVCSAVTLSSCEITNPFEGEAPVEQLRIAEARWRARGLASYRYVSTVSCFCGSVGAADVTVINGVVTRVVRRSDGVIEARPSRVPIDSLFTFIREQLDERPERLSVTYDQILGYPRSIQWGTPENDGGGFIGAEGVQALR